MTAGDMIRAPGTGTGGRARGVLLAAALAGGLVIALLTIHLEGAWTTSPVG